MKRMKKLFALLLAVVMMMGLSLTTFAAPQEGPDELEKGTITINDAIPGQTYSIYQIAYLESYNAEKKVYAYKANSDWESWLKTQEEYVSVNAQGYVTWVEDANAAEFAKLALAYAKDNSVVTAIVPQEAPEAGAGETYSTVEFQNLKLGYYLVDSSAGALCSLNTTNPNATIEEKNEVPTIDKEAVNDTDTKSPSVGDTVNFKITINAKPGAENYILHDEMGTGLTLDVDSIKVYVGTLDEGSLLDAANYTLKTSDLKDNCDFEIEFSTSYLDTITTNTTLYVTYNAVINENAVTGTDFVTNKAILDYGDDNHTGEETTTTEVYSFDLVKTDTDNKVLDGAKFELYDAQTNGNKIDLVKTGNGTYRPATAKEVGTPGFESAVIETVNGKATIDGLGSGTYYLEEIKAPDGYNKLAERQSVTIGTADNNATVNDGVYVKDGVHVINEAGSLLPSTGGMGTTLIYIAGAVLVIGAGVLLVVRRRMNAER